MRRHVGGSVTLGLVLWFCGVTQAAQPTVSAARVAVWDTKRAGSGPLDGTALAEPGAWHRITRGQAAEPFQGDAVLTGGPTVVVWRRSSADIELYSSSAAGVVLRARLQLLTKSGATAARIEQMHLVENSRSAARVEATCVSTKGEQLAAQLRVKRGDIAVEIRPGQSAGRLRAHCAGRFAILPDFFADDIVLDARSVPIPSVDLPSENFLLQTTERDDALLMYTFEHRDQDVQVSLSGSGENRTIVSSEVGFGQGGRVWVIPLCGRQIWRHVDVDATKNRQPTQLSWKVPFPAQWRVDFTRANSLTDSWEALVPNAKGSGFLKPNWLGQGASRITADRKRWTTVLGWFEYPCWIDGDGRAHIQPLKHRTLTFQGPAVIYPIHRLPDTPSDQFTVVDVVRNTLGVGPCEYILDVENQKQEYKGRATCAARDALTAIYSKNQQERRPREIEQALDDALAFVTHIRGRITQYVAFAKKMRNYLATQKKAHPELSEFLEDMDQICGQIDSRVREKLEIIKTPAYVADMNERFRRELLHADGPDTMGRVKQYTKALTQIGGNQDELVGHCRWTAKMLRQRAGIAMATDPRCASIARHIREECQKVMLKPATYEAARH